MGHKVDISTERKKVLLKWGKPYKWVLGLIPEGFKGDSSEICSAFLAGAPEGIRTPNLLIRSQILYPMSHGRV